MSVFSYIGHLILITKVTKPLKVSSHEKTSPVIGPHSGTNIGPG